MNPLTQIRSRIKQRRQEVLSGIPESASYHSQYRRSAYIYAGQLSFKLTEGDLLAIFSQYGEIVDVNLVRDKQTHDSRGFAFIAYDDQRSTDLAVDNLNGATIVGRTIAVDHVLDYKRLVENEDAADPSLTHVATQERREERLQPDGRILAGAEAEAAEDELGVTTGRLQPAEVRPSNESASAKPPWEEGGTSVAALLRNAESMLTDMKREEPHVAKAEHRRDREGQPHDRKPRSELSHKRKASRGEEEDPMASMLNAKRHKGRKEHKKDKHKEKKHTHKEKDNQPDHRGAGKQKEGDNPTNYSQQRDDVRVRGDAPRARDEDRRRFSS